MIENTKNKLIKISIIIYRFMMAVFYYLMGIFPIKNKKIVILNYYGKGYGDNAKYIVEEILKQNLDLEIIWLVNRNFEYQFPKEVGKVYKNSFLAIYHMATAKIWIDNCRKNTFIKKRKNQFYIQTWHGGIALKKIEKDAENSLNRRYLIDAKYDSKIANLFLSNSSICTKMFRESFWYDGDILECGSPRCDILFQKNNKTREKILNYYNLDFHTKILLYAPTFRKDLSLDEYDINFQILLPILKEKFGGKWVIMLRLHPNLKGSSLEVDLESLINVTNFDDMYELLAASDILITDYSSTMFEFSITKRPVFLYASDLSEYNSDRGFYFDIYNLPYPLAIDNDDLVDNIKKFEAFEYQKKLDAFFREVDLKENGQASEKVVKVIKSIIRKNGEYDEK
jgi:CDP-glycerol glycerophosphotransferase